MISAGTNSADSVLSPNPNSFCSSPFSSMLYRGRRPPMAAGEDGGATARPFAGACAHLRVSALSSTGCAEVPLSRSQEDPRGGEAVPSGSSGPSHRRHVDGKVSPSPLVSRVRVSISQKIKLRFIFFYLLKLRLPQARSTTQLGFDTIIRTLGSSRHRSVGNFFSIRDKTSSLT